MLYLSQNIYFHAEIGKCDAKNVIWRLDTSKNCVAEEKKCAHIISIIDAMMIIVAVDEGARKTIASTSDGFDSKFYFSIAVWIKIAHRLI